MPLWGQQYLAEGSIKRAADAYYDALRLDPTTKDYALQVAQTQEMLGDRETALSAYAKCLSLDPGRTEPYQAVAQIYQQMGDMDRAANALKVGYDNTGDLELLHRLSNPDLAGRAIRLPRKRSGDCRGKGLCRRGGFSEPTGFRLGAGSIGA